MEEEKIIDNKVLDNDNKKEKIHWIPMIIILVLVLGLASFAVYKYLQGTNPKTVYETIIDKLAANFNKELDKNFKNGVQGAKYEFNLNIESSNNEIKEIANLVNKMNFAVDLETDLNNKVMNLGFDLIYDSETFINGNMLYKGNTAYLKVDDMYNRPISFNLEDYDNIWNAYKKDDYKVIVSELSSILKGNLKDKYFTTKDEKIDINGKSVDTYKHIIKLDRKDMEEYYLNVLDSILNNKKLMESLANVSTQEQKDIKESILQAKKEASFEGLEVFTVEINLNRLNRNVEKVAIKVNKEELNFIKSDNDKFDILVKNGEIGDVIGSIELKNNYLNLDVDYEGSKINYIINDENYEMKMAFNNNGINMNFSINKSGINSTVEMNIKLDDTTIKMNANITEKSIKKVNEFSVDNSKDVNDLNEEDLEKIYNNLLQNSVLTKIIQDINNLNQAVIA